MTCPPFTNTAEARVSTDAQLRQALLVDGHTWIRLTANITLNSEIDLSPLYVCGGHQFIRIESDTDSNPNQRYTLTKGFSGGSMFAWRHDRFGVDTTVSPAERYTMHFSLAKIVLDGGGKSGNLVEIHQSDRGFFWDVEFSNCGGDGVVIGPTSKPTGDYAVPEDVGPGEASCSGTYQNGMMLFLDCDFTDNAGVALRLTSAIDVTIQGGGASGNGTDLSFIGPSFQEPCSGLQEPKDARGIASIFKWPSSTAYMDLVYGIHTEGSMPPSGVTQGSDCYCMDLNV